ncbi:sensor histidine kinase, partial [Micromonospora azadirachtae]
MSRFSFGSQDWDHRRGRKAVVTLTGASGLLVTATILGWWSGRSLGPLFALDLAAGTLSWLLSPLMLWRPGATTALIT